ncbi:right-handed parallel beta-helix repeat-containing protein [Parabacteroides faecis]|uniref:right-handed parallel beta-helix repeat-containing protein n=1 Tax=Parabacteroides faecis TaxID=1217282 RepID=UPI003A9550AD
MSYTKYFLVLCFILFACYVKANRIDTVYVSDFGVLPNTYENVVTGLQEAIRACKQTGAKVLCFPKGRYDIWPEGAVRAEYFISNTSTEEECPSKIKTVGLLFKEMEDLIVEGNGSLLMYHGKMITMVLDHCKNIQIRNISTNFQRPTASEIRYTRVATGETVVTLHPDSWYEIVDGYINLFGEGWKSNRIHCNEYDAEKKTSVYTNGWNVLSKSKAKELSHGVVSFSTPSDFHPKEGNILTARDVIRDQVGMFILESRDIVLQHVNMHYMHGLGIVSQFVNNITMDHVNCVPPEGSGRILAASADMMHFSGCSGMINISDCRYEGAHDDPINIHGTNLRIMEKMDANTLRLRFMHGQSYGFVAFHEGDEVAFIRAKRMERYQRAKVQEVRRVSDREVIVRLDNPVPADIEFGLDCVENMTCTPEVEIRNSYFTRTCTRGLLITTPRKAIIENNTFEKTGMSAILIEGDAEGWFESGPVCDILIRNNTFIDCAYQGGPGNAVIALNPSNTQIDPDRPVHKNVRIEDNEFQVFDYPILYAKSTKELAFKNNTVIRTKDLHPRSSNKQAFFLNGCSQVVIEGTNWEGDILSSGLHLENMKKKHVRFSKDITLDK